MEIPQTHLDAFFDLFHTDFETAKEWLVNETVRRDDGTHPTNEYIDNNRYLKSNKEVFMRTISENFVGVITPPTIISIMNSSGIYEGYIKYLPLTNSEELILKTFEDADDEPTQNEIDLNSLFMYLIRKSQTDNQILASAFLTGGSDERIPIQNVYPQLTFEILRAINNEFHYWKPISIRETNQLAGRGKAIRFYVGQIWR